MFLSRGYEEAMQGEKVMNEQRHPNIFERVLAHSIVGVIHLVDWVCERIYMMLISVYKWILWATEADKKTS